MVQYISNQGYAGEIERDKIYVKSKSYSIEEKMASLSYQSTKIWHKNTIPYKKNYVQNSLNKRYMDQNVSSSQL